METSNSIEIQFYFIIHLHAFYWNTPYQAHVQNDFFYTKKAVTVAVVILMTIALCSSDIQEVKTQFLKNKVFTMSYATKQHISKLICVQ